MSANGRPSTDQSLGQLVSSVTSNVASLVRLEIELAKSELTTQVRSGATGGGLAAAAALLALLAIVLFSIAAALALALVVPGWAAFLIVGAVYVLVAALLVFLSMRRFKQIKGPQRATVALDQTKTVLTDRAAARAAAKASGVSAADAGLLETDERARVAARDAGRQAAAGGGAGPA